MVDICLYFQVHQPLRMRHFTVFDIGNGKEYFDEKRNREIMQRVAKKCYLPANQMMLDLIKDTKGKFKVSYSITGVAIEQFRKYAPEVLESFRELAKHPQVEFLSETYHHSLSYLYDKEEFKAQVKMHKELMKKEFGRVPKVFRNTELIYTNSLAHDIQELGFKAVLAEGADHILGWKSPNFVYRTNTEKPLPLLLKNYRLSDDIAFRFSNKGWKEHPLTAEKYASWVNAVNGNGTTINLFMDYETLGEHQWASTGIFRFFKEWPKLVLQHPDNRFSLPSEVADHPIMDTIDIPGVVSWADVERDLSAWLGNQMQQAALNEIFSLGKFVKQTNDKSLLSDWRALQTSDHFYYMCTKWFADGDVHKYFNPYDSPYEAFIAFMNILNDLIIRLKEHELTRRVAQDIKLRGSSMILSESPSRMLDGGDANV